MLPPLLMFGVYPILWSMWSLFLLISNLLYGREYETMYSWHRNSIMKLMNNVIYASCVIPTLTRLLLLVKQEGLYITRDEVQQALIPMVVFSCAVLTMNVCVIHKNTSYWAIIALSLLVQFTFLFVDNFQTTYQN